MIAMYVIAAIIGISLVWTMVSVCRQYYGKEPDYKDRYWDEW